VEQRARRRLDRRVHDVLRREALAAVGLLDETFFAYHGSRLVYARAPRMARRVPAGRGRHPHRRGASGGRASIRIRKYFAARNSVLFARKHATAAQGAKLAGLLAVGLPLQLLWHLPRGTAGEVVLKMRGVRDALAGRRPPFEMLGLK
jgi:GT2 family glycosyltransferase